MKHVAHVRGGVGDGKVGLFGLTSLIVGSAIGSGIFALPATLTGGAGALGILCGWAIVAFGMLSLVSVYRNLTLRQPNIDDGIYGWSKAGFGHIGGFIGAYGHGAGDAIGNASYLVVIFSALGAFGVFNYFGDGTTWPAIFVASALLWIINALVLRGVKTSTMMNNVATVAKVVPIVLFLALAIYHFDSKVFMTDFRGESHGTSIFDQSKTVLLAAMWTLIGLESGTIYATRARKLSDVAKASTLGAIIVSLLLVGTSVLALGILPAQQITQLHQPSMAGIMAAMVGPWGGMLINICLIVSVVGALIAWVTLSSEEVMLSGRGKSATAWLGRLNENGAPRNAMWLTTGIAQAMMLVAGFSHAGYLALLSFSTSLALIPYLLSSMYSFKCACNGRGYEGEKAHGRWWELGLSAFAICFVLFMLYGAGLKYVLLAAVVWAIGLPLFILGKREQGSKLTIPEWMVCLAVVGMALAGLLGLWTGHLTL
ncbi:amino acid permease [Pseudomonas nitroreducens]|uniref:Amino acid permease n=1 Tax=Pseudomonas nitroreducens TaxID=46680 RepID=A0A5R8ZTU9_PSENT|nr:amino acid permease [Pseudomonas nitroreducens]TLP69819.1 amino acid permease [Pseudomonas nitroreducens]